MNIHSEARTTLKIRKEIHASRGVMTIEQAAHHFNVSRETIRKWRQRERFEDRSHRPHQLHTSLNEVQEDIVVMLRRFLLLTLDDLLVITRQFICPTLGRSSLTRLLKRHQVNSLKVLYAELSGEAPGKKPKTFKDYTPGYVHVDLKRLPMIPDDPQKRYLLIAVDRATRWVYLEVTHDKTANTTAGFIKRCYHQCPATIKTILTSNRKAFADRLTAPGEYTSTDTHAFGKVCLTLAIKHQLIPPGHPHTDGAAKHSNGQLSKIVRSTHFRSAEKMIATLEQCHNIYNHRITQRNLGHLTPVKAMKAWQKEKPELFEKRRRSDEF